MMRIKILWICGLPEEVRSCAMHKPIASDPCAAWGWVLGHLPPPDGIELHIACSSRSLIKKELHFQYKGAIWHCFKELRGSQYVLQIPLIWRVKRLVRALSPRIVNGWGGETGYGWIATCITKSASVNVQGLLRMLKENERLFGLRSNKRWSLDWKVREVVEILTYRRAARLFCESCTSQESLLNLYGYKSNVIYQPLRWAFLAEIINTRVSACPTFLYIGEMVDRKGPMDALRAFLPLKHYGVKLIMVGAGPLELQARDFVDGHGLKDCVQFYKGLRAEEIISLMRVSDFFVLPSYGDTGPTALKEALSQGLFPICYDNTGPKELIERYEFGILCPTGNLNALTTAMEEAIEHRLEMRKRSPAVAKNVKRDLSPENIWPSLLAAYEKVSM